MAYFAYDWKCRKQNYLKAADGSSGLNNIVHLHVYYNATSSRQRHDVAYIVGEANLKKIHLHFSIVHVSKGVSRVSCKMVLFIFDLGTKFGDCDLFEKSVCFLFKLSAIESRPYKNLLTTTS